MAKNNAAKIAAKMEQPALLSEPKKELGWIKDELGWCAKAIIKILKSDDVVVAEDLVSEMRSMHKALHDEMDLKKKES